MDCWWLIGRESQFSLRVWLLVSDYPPMDGPHPSSVGQQIWSG